MTAAEFRKLHAKKPKGQSWARRAKPEARTADGIVFDSRAERTVYLDTVKPLLFSKAILWWCYHPVFFLGGAAYEMDFLIAWRPIPTPTERPRCFAEFELIEVKGLRANPEVIRRTKRNLEQMKTLWGISVRIEQR